MTQEPYCFATTRHLSNDFTWIKWELERNQVIRAVNHLILFPMNPRLPQLETTSSGS